MNRYYIDKDGEKGGDGTETSTQAEKRKTRAEINEEKFQNGLKKLRKKQNKAAQKYTRGDFLSAKKAVEHPRHYKKYQAESRKAREVVQDAARSELLLSEQAGLLIPDKLEKCYQITQKEIIEAVDITTASKHFSLELNFGPYLCDYSRNGRELLIGGKRGHVAAIDWLTKDLHCEFNVQESIHDVTWLHMPVMFAVAQKDYVHIYDNQGTELHCLKKLFNVKKLTFLPYHFLLVSASESSILSWTDVSTGKLIKSFRAPQQRLTTCMKQIPSNAITVTGHANGVACMWSPNDNEPVVKLLAHTASIRDLAIDHLGRYLVTCGVDRTMKIWDLRNYKCMQNYKLKSIPNCLDISQQNMIAVASGNFLEVYKDCYTRTTRDPYLRHRLDESMIAGARFCPYEDVLGLSHERGFTSMIIPGSGEPNFDAYEANPFMTKSQRREMEVKQLLDKIQPELISLDPFQLSKVDVAGLKESLEEKKKLPFVKVKDIEFEVKKNVSGIEKMKINQQLKENETREMIKEINLKRKADELKAQKSNNNKNKRNNFNDSNNDNNDDDQQQKEVKKKSVLDRFRKN